MTSRSGSEQRDRAVVAFMLFTGRRDGILALTKLTHLDLAYNWMPAKKGVKWIVILSAAFCVLMGR